MTGISMESATCVWPTKVQKPAYWQPLPMPPEGE